jgi:hypothetical protein
MTNELQERLQDVVRADSQFMEMLRAARDVNPPHWVIGSGIIRDLVWDRIHGRPDRLDLKDVDLAFFDPSDLSREREAELERQLRARLDVPWEAKNQAAVHLWYERRFGYPVPPLTSIDEAVASWPEPAVCVGVRLLSDDGVLVVAPLGLDDLFGLVLRRNPRRVSVEEFRRRLARKDVATRWPKVRVIPG